MFEAFEKASTEVVAMLDAMSETEARESWLEIVRLQEAIDRVAMLHAPNSDAWKP